ncbi:hypothetical protein DUI87_13977 [Hirundo rustica rustica]|uniref:Uncharacterized protein n=1 Tax=Hirundo rustica rustica TaxID=333673 RepID=A0A3M0KD07_HIRRU|nr:hypothetical protein DUI87_13977 [Hirundo rustica rustica]
MAKEGAQRAEETKQMIEKEGGREAAEGGAGGSLRAGDAKEMRAVVLSASGGLNKLRVSKKAMPEPQEGELKIRVKAWSSRGCPRQAEVAVPEKLQRLDSGSPKIQQDSEETPNSWILQQMVEFPGPDPLLTVDSSSQQPLIRASRKTRDA